MLLTVFADWKMQFLVTTLVLGLKDRLLLKSKKCPLSRQKIRQFSDNSLFDSQQCPQPTKMTNNLHQCRKILVIQNRQIPVVPISHETAQPDQEKVQKIRADHVHMIQVGQESVRKVCVDPIRHEMIQLV